MLPRIVYRWADGMQLLLSFPDSALRHATSYTLLTSCFSHEDVMHLAFNGFTFYFMAPHVLGILGNVSFLGLYLGGASDPLSRRSYYGSHLCV